MKTDGERVPLEALEAEARRIARTAGCRLVVLFGSGVREEPGRTPEDYDIALLADRPLDLVDLTNRFIRALSTQEVDLVDLRRADPLLMMMVARDGVPLFEATPGAFARFVSLAARRFADTRKFREAEREEVRRRLSRADGLAPEPDETP